MKTKVIINKNQLNYFRKLARNSPLEIEAVLVGKETSQWTIIVHEFVYPEEYAIQTNSSVTWFDKDYEEVKDRAKQMGMLVVGDIHSHPNGSSVLSESDYKSLLVDRTLIMGICSVNDGRTHVRFWTPFSSLQCKVEYL